MTWTRRKFLRIGFWSIVGYILVDSLWAEKFFIETNEFYLDVARKKGPSLKIVQVSDLHLQRIGYHHKSLANQLNDLKPDLILFTGDSIDKAENILHLDNFLQLFDSSIKKIAIT